MQCLRSLAPGYRTGGVGMTKPLLMALIAGEGIGLGLAGGVLGTGVLVTVLTLWPVTLGVEGYGINLQPGVHTVVHCLLAALAVGVLASIAPAIAVGRRPLVLSVKAD